MRNKQGKKKSEKAVQIEAQRTDLDQETWFFIAFILF